MESDSDSNLALDNKENYIDFDEEKILDFYSLDTLSPTEWNQDITDDKDEILGLLNNFDISDNYGISEKLNTTDVQVQTSVLEEYDPLGIKKPTYINRNERKKSLAHNNRNINNQELNISKKQFNPVAFLKEIHRGTSYRDLENGSINLRNLVEKRTEILKNLVKDYFEQFVDSKSTIDSFYLDIKEKRRDSSEEQTTDQFNTKLLGVIDMAKDLYGPILDRRNKAEKIRITLNILERWKFFFDLPRKLQECLRLRKIDNAVKNYKKGKYLIQSFTDDNDSSSQIANSSRIPEGQQKVFDEVWSEVNITVKQIHEYLYNQLSDFSIPMKIQEKNIFNLVNLDSKGDPVSFYLNQQFQWNLRVLSSIFTEHASQMKDLKKEIYGNNVKFSNDSQTDLKSVSMERLLEILNVDEKPPTHLYQNMNIKRLQRDLINLNSKINDYEIYIGNEYDCQIWVKMTKAIKNLSSILMKFLPDYWKLCMHYIEGRYDQDSLSKKKKNEAKEENDRAEKCQLIIRQMIELYSILISKILFLDNSLEELSEKTRSIFNELIANDNDNDDNENNDNENNSEDESIESEESDNELILESQNSLEGKKEILVIPLKKSSDSKNKSSNSIRKVKRKGIIGISESEKNKENNNVIDTSTTKSILYNPVSHLDTIGNAAFAEANKEKELNGMNLRNKSNESRNANIEEDNENDKNSLNLNKNNVTIIVDPGSEENIASNKSNSYSVLSSPIKLNSLEENASEHTEDNSHDNDGKIKEDNENEYKTELTTSNLDITVIFKKQIIPLECSLFVNSHPLIICYFISIILKNVTNTFNKIKALKYNKEELILSPLHELINNLKLRAVELISKNTIEETKTFFKYENWIMDDDIYSNLKLRTSDTNNMTPGSAVSTKPQSIISNNNNDNINNDNNNKQNEKSSTTLYIKLFYNFLKFIIRTLNVITKLHTVQEASVLTVTENYAKSKKTNSIHNIRSSKYNFEMFKLEDNIELYEKLIKLIETCVIKSNFALLDSFNLLSIASESEINQMIEKEELKNPLIGTTNIKENDNSSGVSNIANIGVLYDSISSELNNINISSATTMVDHHKKPRTFDIKNNDIKTLIVMSNIMAFEEVIFPKIQDFYESSFRNLSLKKIDELYESSKFLNSQLFEKYLRNKLIKIRVIVRKGILYSGFDWYYITIPHEVSPYITKLIIEIVKIHSQITDISRKLQHMMLSEIFLNLAQDILEAFREIDHYSVAGMLQATLETEVVHQTLSNYEIEKTSEILKQIYQRVEKNVILDDNASSEAMTKMLNDVKSKLSQYQKQMALITSCFTENKEKNKFI